jgi:hypothetical protein
MKVTASTTLLMYPSVGRGCDSQMIECDKKLAIFLNDATYTYTTTNNLL